MVRFQNTLKQLERGEKVSPVQLRDGDLLSEYRDSFNSYLASAGLLLDGETFPEQSGAEGESKVLDELRDLSEDVAETNLSADESPEECEDLQPTAVDS